MYGVRKLLQMPTCLDSYENMLIDQASQYIHKAEFPLFNGPEVLYYFNKLDNWARCAGGGQDWLDIL